MKTFCDDAKKTVCGRLWLFLPMMLYICFTILISTDVAAGQNRSSAKKTPAGSVQQPRGSALRLRTSPVLIRSDSDCNIIIDSNTKLFLLEGTSRVVDLLPGEHALSAVSTDGLDEWDTTFEVEKNIRIEISIQLFSKRQAREEAQRRDEENRKAAAERLQIEQEIERLEKEIKNNERRVNEARIAREKLARERKTDREKEVAIQRRVDEFVNRIKACELQMKNELFEADKCEKDANNNEILMNFNAQQGTTLGKVGAVVGAVSVTANRIAAKKHREAAQRQLAEIQSVTRQLYILSTEPESTIPVNDLVDDTGKLARDQKSSTPASGFTQSQGTSANFDEESNQVNSFNGESTHIALASNEKRQQPAEKDNRTTQAQLGQQQFAASAQGKPESKLLSDAGAFSDEKIPAGSKIFIATMQDGFDTYVAAGLQRKSVPLVVVVDPDKADYQMSGVSESEKAGWAKMLFLGSQQTNESASIKIVNVRTGNVVFAYSVNKINSVRGKQSSAESVAKHIKEKIRK